MLVDLARNDIGRVCDFGSVQVKDLMIIERYNHVMHIVSSVEGKLAGGKTPYDLMRATDASTAGARDVSGGGGERRSEDYFSQLIVISFPKALNSESPVTSSAFFSLASAAAKASARLILKRALKSPAMSANARVAG